jgi:transcriptional regulator with XRE-family HTH domain
MDTATITIGQRIRLLRKKKRMKLEAVAKGAGISISTLSRIENELKTAQSWELVSLSDALQCPMSSILGAGT